MTAEELFDRQLSRWGLAVGTGTRERLVDYANLLSGYDLANVIGTRDFGRVLNEHILDSMSCLLFEPLGNTGSVADVGSGGGLPGIPLALALPDAEVHLLEATGKKAVFLSHAVTKLGLQNVRVHNGRVEEAARSNDHRARYDVCTVRAVARLPVVAEYCLPLARVGGYVVAMKAREDAEELDEGRRAAEMLGGDVREEIQVPLLPELEQRDRRLVVLQKMEATPQAYPRKTGMPARKPLGAKRGRG
jgi:16S rRNA (guanine527-N7)-methyltransferase